MNDAAPLLVERTGALLQLTLNRPGVGNAIDVALAKALMYAAIEADADTSIRAVTLTGSGRCFCVGGDVSAFAAQENRLPLFLKEITSYLHSAISRLARMEKPLLVAVNGPAAGAGFSLAILGDLVFAARSAHFTLAYTALGLSPDGGSTWLLPRLVGLRAAQELALTNRRVGADEAAALGLVTRVVEDGALASVMAETTTELTAAATGAIGRTRALLLSSFSATLEGQMEAESRAIAGAGDSPEGRERIAAFLRRKRSDRDAK